MSILDTIKSSPKLYKAWQAQNKIKKETESITSYYEDKGMSVILRGDKRVEKLIINGEEKPVLKNFLNDAMKKLDKKLEKEMQGSASEFMEMLKQ